MPASSAPHRSQYHSVGRLSVPHSPHLSVFAPPAAPGFPGAAVVWLAVPDPSADLAADGPGLLPRRPEGCGGFRSSSGATDFRNAISSTGGGPCVISASLDAGLGTGRAAATGTAGGGANRSGSGSGSGAAATGGGGGGGAAGGGSTRFGAPPINPCTSASRAISSPTARSSPRRRPNSSPLWSLIRCHSSSEYSPTAWRTSASESAS